MSDLKKSGELLKKIEYRKVEHCGRCKHNRHDHCYLHNLNVIKMRVCNQFEANEKN